MVFSSLLFIVGFLPIFLLCYYAVPRCLKNTVALIGSYFFYAWGEPIFAVLLFVSSIGDYWLSRYLDHFPKYCLKQRNLILAGSIVLNLGFLAYFKYANFFVHQFNDLLGLVGTNPLAWREIALPIGISFFSFQKMSYMMDVYRGTVRPASSFLDYALYVVLFPQLIAGPIVRYHDVAAQMETRTHSLEKFVAGIWRFALGLGKKVLLANVMATVADWAFQPQLESLPMPYAWFGLFAYSFQIYFDFSGYSDMAIGLGRMIGFEFLENFNRPYISASITEFWRRWHISLSNWFLEYLYIPLGGNRCSRWRSYVNLWIVFLCSGLWHGASWTFVIWGAYHGGLLTIERLFRGHDAWKLPAGITKLRTFLLASLGWVLFRCETFPHAFHYFGRLIDVSTLTSLVIPDGAAAIFDHRAIAIFILSAIICFFPERLPLPEALLTKKPVANIIAAAQYAAMLFLLVLSISSLVNMDFNPFIYFRF